MIDSSLIEISLLASLAVILPIVPAYVLYKTLPAKTTVTGPFKGLDIQLTGAFGGYFLVLLVVVGLLFALQPPPPGLQVWEVSGRVASPRPVELSDFSIQPPRADVGPDGSFELSVLVEVDAEGNFDFPTVFISRPGFEPATISFNAKRPTFGTEKYEWDADKKARKIYIRTPVKLRPEGRPQ